MVPLVDKFFIIYLITILYALSGTDAWTKCVIAQGTLVCAANRKFAADVEIFLQDEDEASEDDRMAWTISDDNGKFSIEGCAYDLLSDPDPYIAIFTYCNAPRGKWIRKYGEHVFKPDVLKFGEISLD